MTRWFFFKISQPLKTPLFRPFLWHPPPPPPPPERRNARYAPSLKHASLFALFYFLIFTHGFRVFSWVNPPGKDSGWWGSWHKQRISHLCQICRLQVSSVGKGLPVFLEIRYSARYSLWCWTRTRGRFYPTRSGPIRIAIRGLLQ